MNIRYALTDGFGDDAVDQPDNGCIIGTVEKIVGAWQHVGQQVAVAHADGTGHGGGGPIHGIMVGQIAVERAVVGYLNVKRHRQITPDFQQYQRVRTLPHCDDQTVINLMAQHNAMGFCKSIGNVDQGGACNLLHRLFRYGFCHFCRVCITTPYDHWPPPPV